MLIKMSFRKLKAILYNCYVLFNIRIAISSIFKAAKVNSELSKFDSTKDLEILRQHPAAMR